MMKVGKLYNYFEFVPILLSVYSLICFGLSFHYIYDDWFRDFSCKNIECPMLFVILLWVMSVRLNWGVIARASILHLFALNIADNVFLMNKDLIEYGTWFAVASFALALVYIFVELRVDEE